MMPPERVAKSLDRATAEKIQRHRGQEHRAGSDDRAAEGWFQRLLISYLKLPRTPVFKSSRMLLVENDDGGR